MPKVRVTHKCPECNSSKDGFKTAEQLKWHYDAVHLGLRPYKCGWHGCTKDFTQPARLKDHVKYDHEGHVRPRPHKCPKTDCRFHEEGFPTKQALKIHVKTHNDVREFPCKWRGCKAKPFAQKGQLTRHVNMVHLLERPHLCPVDGCIRTFATPEGLRTHLDSSLHNNVRPFKCADCPLAFTQQTHLDSHIACVHLELRPWQCTRDGCTETFARRDHLANHVHTVHKGGNKTRKKSEDAMARFLTEHGIDFKREHHIGFSCTEVHDDHFARIDFVTIRNGVVIMIENDERQHDWIETVCDVKRMAEVVETLACEGNTLPIAFIRFNPHDFRADGQVQHMHERDRRMHLLNVLMNPEHPIFNKEQPLKVMHMFYDTVGGFPQVLKEYGLLVEVCIPFTPITIKDGNVKASPHNEDELSNWLSTVSIDA